MGLVHRVFTSVNIECLQAHLVPVYFPAYVNTHCAYLQKDGQAELMVDLDGYIQVLTRRRQLTSLPKTILQTTIPSSQLRNTIILKSREKDRL